MAQNHHNPDYIKHKPDLEPNLARLLRSDPKYAPFISQFGSEVNNLVPLTEQNGEISESAASAIVEAICAELSAFFAGRSDVTDAFIGYSVPQSDVTKGGSAGHVRVFADIGGTKLKLLFAYKSGINWKFSDPLDFLIPEAAKQYNLFPWIAEKISAFLSREIGGISDAGTPEIRLYVVWSFPVAQRGCGAEILRMGKGFCGLDGLRIDMELRKCLEAEGIVASVRFVVPDSVALFAATERKFRRSVAGGANGEATEAGNGNVAFPVALVLGTGLNLSFGGSEIGTEEPNCRLIGTKSIKNAKNAEILTTNSIIEAELQPQLPQLPQNRIDCRFRTIFNTEISKFGGSSATKLGTTIWDIRVAQRHNSFQPLEILTGGKYIGEVAQQILSDVLFCVYGVEKVADRFLWLTTEECGRISACGTIAEVIRRFWDVADVADVAEMPILEAEAELVREICRSIAARASMIVACLIISLWLFSGNPGREVVQLGYTGSVVCRFAGFRERMVRHLRCLARKYDIVVENPTEVALSDVFVALMEWDGRGELE